MNEESDQKVRVMVTWDGGNVEIRMLNAIEELCRKGQREGLTATGVARIGQYIASAALDQSIRIQEPNP